MQALSILSVPQSFLDLDDLAPIPAKHDSQCNTIHEIHNDDQKNIDEKEFSFACNDTKVMPIFADDIFDNGKIRPLFYACEQSLLLGSESNVFSSPLRPPLKKLFVKQNNNFCSERSGSVKEAHDNPSQNLIMVEVTASNNSCKKSNSTGFSKMWRFRQDLKLRSNSDGKDAFVFLNPPLQENHNGAKVKNIPVKKGNGGKCKTTLSAHEKLYVMNRMRKESTKRKSFLPYNQNLLGLFFNASTFSKNLHPF